MKIIRNGELVLTDNIIQTDLVIEGESISHIGPVTEIPKDADIIDATGCLVFPGFIDPHTHFQMTNALASTADDFESGSKAAIAGGTTSIINFASPEEGSLVKGLEVHRKRAESKCSCDYAFHMEIIDVNDTVLRDIPRVVEQGVQSFKIYLAYAFRLHDDDVYKAIKGIKDTGALVAAHCENGPLIDALVEEYKRNHCIDVSNHPKTRPVLIESEAINRWIEIGHLAEYPVHVVHVSSQEGLTVIEEQRKKGRHVTCETCPQYLVLDESVYALPNFEGGKYVMSPPLRTEKDQQALLVGLADGRIQTVGSDHCSFTFEQQKKQGINDFTKIPGGIPGVEERSLVTYEALVNKGNATPITYMKVMSENPAKLYGLYPKKGALTVGSDADITIIDPRRQTILSHETAHTKADYIPFEGMAIEGGIVHVFLRGHHVVEDGEIINAHLGKYIP